MLIYDDFRADNEGTVRRVRRFLGVDDDAADRADRDETDQVRALDAHRTSCGAWCARRSLNPERASPLARTLSTLMPRRVRRGALSRAYRSVAYAQAKPPDVQFMRELRERCREEVVAAGEYLDRDLVALWGYDKLG